MFEHLTIGRLQVVELPREFGMIAHHLIVGVLLTLMLMLALALARALILAQAFILARALVLAQALVLVLVLVKPQLCSGRQQLQIAQTP